MDFRNLPISFFIPWPIRVLVFVGLASIIMGVSFAIAWVISHLQWVP